MDRWIVAARVALALVFALAGGTKLADLEGSRRALREFGLPDRLAALAGTGLPLAELAVAILLVTRAAWWGALGASALLVAFIGGIAVSLARGKRPECHCFGQLHSAPVGAGTLLRNGALAVVAAWLVAQGRSAPFPPVLGVLGVLGVALLVGQGWLLLQVVRQNGRLLVRVEALEARAGIAGGETPERGRGLSVGSTAPRFQLDDLAGRTIALDALRARRRPVVLVFSDVGCGPCTALLPDVARWQREHGDAVTIALVVRGAREAIAAKVAGRGLTDVLPQRDREVGNAYAVQATPSAVLVAADGRVGSRLVVGGGAIAALVERAAGLAPSVDPEEEAEAEAQPEPVPIGAPLPPFTLDDLAGAPVRLADFRGRPTLLVFWDPSCGFCQDMADMLRAWAIDAPHDAPRLLVISRGAAADVAAMDLRAPVVLDHEFAVANALGASGTPMAVLLDADGRVASPVRAGAAAVLALARTRTATETVLA